MARVTQSDLAAWLTDQLQHTVPVETTRELFSVAASETKRMIVFAPKLCPFTHRSPNSLRHPRISQVVWANQLVSSTVSAGGAPPTTGGHSHTKLSSNRVGLARWLHMEPAMRKTRLQGEESLFAWESVGYVFDGLLSNSPIAGQLRSHILTHPDWLAYTRKIFNRLAPTTAPPAPASPNVSTMGGNSRLSARATLVKDGTADPDTTNSRDDQRTLNQQPQPPVISQAAFCYFEVKLVNVYFDPGAVLDALDAIDEDFLFDSKDSSSTMNSSTNFGDSDGGGRAITAAASMVDVFSSTFYSAPPPPSISFSAFNLSMLELADSWTSTVHVDEYVAFLDDLYTRVFAADWQEELDIILIGQAKKRVPNATAIHQFNEWTVANKTKKQTQLKKYLTAIDAEDLAMERRKKSLLLKSEKSAEGVGNGSRRTSESSQGIGEEEFTTNYYTGGGRRALKLKQQHQSGGSQIHGESMVTSAESRIDRLARSTNNDRYLAESEARESRPRRMANQHSKQQQQVGPSPSAIVGGLEWTIAQKLQSQIRLSPHEVRYLMEKRKALRMDQEAVQYQCVAGKLMTLTSQTTLSGAISTVRRQFPSKPPPPISANSARPNTAGDVASEISKATRKPRPPGSAIANRFSASRRITTREDRPNSGTHHLGADALSHLAHPDFSGVGIPRGLGGEEDFDDDGGSYQKDAHVILGWRPDVMAEPTSSGGLATGGLAPITVTSPSGVGRK